MSGAAPALAAAAPADKKAPAKTPADLAFDEFNKVRTEQGRMDQARFQKVIAAGLAYLTQHPTHSRVNEGIRDLAFFARSIDAKQPALRTSFTSLLKLEVTNQRYKEGLSEPVSAVLAALDAAIADYDVRETYGNENVATLREKIDALAQTPGGGRFLTDRERSFANILLLGANSVPRAEAHLTKLLEHKEKAVATMAREELNILELKKQPYALKFTALDGKDVDFEQLRGKVVALYFWSSTNKQSTDRLEQLRQIYSDYRKRGFEIVTVSYDKAEDREKLEKYIKDNKVAWPVYFDGKAAKNEFSPKLNAGSVPRLYLFDQKGILQTIPLGSPIANLTPNLANNMNVVEPQVKRLLGIK